MQVPAPFDKEETKDRLKKLPGGPSSPLNVHLRQEIDRLNIILRLTSTTLKNLRLAVAGGDCHSGSWTEILAIECQKSKSRA